MYIKYGPNIKTIENGLHYNKSSSHKSNANEDGQGNVYQARQRDQAALDFHRSNFGNDEPEVHVFEFVPMEQKLVFAKFLL